MSWQIIGWQFKKYIFPVAIFLILIFAGWYSLHLIYATQGDHFIAKVIFESIVMGFVGSLIFLIFLFSLKPSIKIADKICYNPVKEKFYFKMINKSYFFPIKDVEIRVEHGKLRDAIGEGNNVEMINIPLKNSTFTHVPSIKRGKKSENIYAFIVESQGLTKNGDSIHDILDRKNNHNFIEVSVYAKHSLSGFSIQKRAKYKNERHLKNGEYNTGTNINILSLS